VSAPTATALVVVVIGNAVFGRRVPAGNVRAREVALRPAGVFDLSGGGDDPLPPDASERVNYRLLVRLGREDGSGGDPGGVERGRGCSRIIVGERAVGSAGVAPACGRLTAAARTEVVAGCVGCCLAT